MKLSIIIPVYNESENIHFVLDAIKKHVKTEHEILICYDCDGDTTILPVKKRIEDGQSNIVLCKNSIASGPSGAIRSGFKMANGKFYQVLMGDLCDDVTQIDFMVSEMEKGVDVYCPSRYCKGGNQDLEESLKKWLPMAAGFLLRCFTGINTHDPTNSFKLYSADMIKTLNLVSTVSFSVTLEIVVKAHIFNYSIKEIPTNWKNRDFGKSNFKFFRSVLTYTPWFLLALTKNRFFKVSRLFHKVLV
ncbi:MAG: glycosyltransferase [Bacteriovoracaceae bacterium]|nr:glycosyltransferase [Bacteriovoracaceae bacterium]